jgi:hypothetical protein
MTVLDENNKWDVLSREQKNHQLYLKQKELLETFLSKGAITKKQFEKSLRDLTEKMGE